MLLCCVQLLSEAIDRPPLTRAGFAKGRTYASVRARVNEEKTSQQHFMVLFLLLTLQSPRNCFLLQEAQTAFDDASSHRRFLFLPERVRNICDYALMQCFARGAGQEI